MQGTADTAGRVQPERQGLEAKNPEQAGSFRRWMNRRWPDDVPQEHARGR
jgi:hypothetical protein